MDIVFPFLAVYAVIFYCADKWLAARPYKGPITNHWNGKKFYSYGAHPGNGLEEHNDWKLFWKWMHSRATSKWHFRENRFRATPQERVMGGEMVVTFVNHATMLIQTEGLNILTDPVWSKRVSPFSFLGPKRYRPVGILFLDLPPIDVVLISHNHYDHMDLATLKRITKKWKPKIYAGLGNARYLRSRGIKNTTDLDWWEKDVLKEGIAVVCAPGQHFSSRALSDRNKTLWCGFVLETPHGDIYFAGDTGYGPFVQKLHERYKKFRLAFLPIGAFRPEWFMGPVHTSPDQAVQMHHELHAETSIAMHFGTFHLADDHQDEPPERIRDIIANTPDPKPNFLVLENGESTMVE
jgi:L-ascorbate metabolism protein UlaG (beta-lactamase superfamily)